MPTSPHGATGQKEAKAAVEKALKLALVVTPIGNHSGKVASPKAKESHFHGTIAPRRNMESQLRAKESPPKDLKVAKT